MKVFKTLFAALLLTGVATSAVPVFAQQEAVTARVTKTQMQTAITNYAASQGGTDQEEKYDAVLKLVFDVLAEQKMKLGGAVEGTPEFANYLKFAEKYDQLIIKKRLEKKNEIVAAMNAFASLM
jgi:hypothetical protein